jgi:hypothetical protein
MNPKMNKMFQKRLANNSLDVAPLCCTPIGHKRLQQGVSTSTNRSLILVNIPAKMLSSAAVIVLLSSAGVLGFVPSTQNQAARSVQLSMSGKPAKGAGFNYDPSNYKDSNSGNYRRLSDQLAAAKFEDEELKREREEIIRKEQMVNMLLRKENETFWNTPGETVIATADRYFVSPSVLQVINDLDNQLIGLKPVSSTYLLPLFFILRSNYIIKFPKKTENLKNSYITNVKLFPTQFSFLCFCRSRRR